MKRTLTGKWYHKSTVFGLVLYVEACYEDDKSEPYNVWEKARSEDVVEMQPVIQGTNFKGE